MFNSHFSTANRPIRSTFISILKHCSIILRDLWASALALLPQHSFPTQQPQHLPNAPARASRGVLSPLRAGQMPAASLPNCPQQAHLRWLPVAFFRVSVGCGAAPRRVPRGSCTPALCCSLHTSLLPMFLALAFALRARQRAPCEAAHLTQAAVPLSGTVPNCGVILLLYRSPPSDASHALTWILRLGEGPCHSVQRCDISDPWGITEHILGVCSVLGTVLGLSHTSLLHSRPSARRQYSTFICDSLRNKKHET